MLLQIDELIKDSSVSGDVSTFFSLKSFTENSEKQQVFEKFGRKNNVEVVDLIKSFPTRIWSSKSASLQRRTDRLKFENEKWMPR